MAERQKFSQMDILLGVPGTEEIEPKKVRNGNAKVPAKQKTVKKKGKKK